MTLHEGGLHDGRRIKFGRRLAVAPAPHFRLKHYLLASLPDEPSICDYTQGASTSAALADVYGNDQLGDCVIAALYHLLALWTGNASGAAFHATPDQIVAMYSAIGGYVKGNPSTDQGCDMTTALNWIVANGYANGDKPLGWVRIDATNAKEVRQAIWLFEGCDFGVGLPGAWVQAMSSMSSGFTWDVAGPAVDNNGHSFMGAGYDSTGVTIDTWGMLGKCTWAAIAKYAVQASNGEIDVLLSADMIASAAAKAPTGFDWRTLVQDFDEIGGTVQTPPAPPGPPAPPVQGPVTLANAQAWAAAGISAAHPLLTQADAVAAANAGLAAGWPTS